MTEAVALRKAVIPSPLDELQSDWLTRAGVRLFVKRDDLIHPGVSGNKYRKLKYNVLRALSERIDTLVSIGGEYSNHLYALSQLGFQTGLQTVGLVRTDELDPENPTLRACQRAGMRLIAVCRSQYRQIRQDPSIVCKWVNDRFLWLPEGGTNPAAIKGCREIVSETLTQAGLEDPVFCVPVGTGGTFAGLVTAPGGWGSVVGYAALKGRKFLKGLTAMPEQQKPGRPWKINVNYHFGGIGKYSEELIDFLHDFRDRFSFPLDPIYTGKMFFGIFNGIQNGYFPAGTDIVAVHTGGLQGIEGFNQKYGKLIQV